MSVPVIRMAIAIVGVNGIGLHFQAEWKCSASRGVTLILYLLLKMSNFKELSCISDY